ncbi:MAG TPA: hypothetical protein V6C86_23365 [Oculatellaceae cyanobacterium]
MNKIDSYACKRHFAVAMFLLMLLTGPSLLEATADVYTKMGKKDLAAQDLQLAKKKDSFSMFP